MDIQVLQEAVEKLHATFESTSLETEARKISHKLEEAHFNSGAVRPIADCVLSLLLAARSRGYDVEEVFTSLEGIARHALNSNWKRMPDGTYQST